MKKYVGELTGVEKAQLKKRHDFLVAFAKFYPPVLIFGMLITVYAVYMTSVSFEAAFLPSNAASTSGFFAIIAVLYAILFFASYGTSDDTKFAVRNYLLCVATVSLTYAACLITSRYLSVFALPISLCSLVLLELLDRRSAMISTLVLLAMLLLSYNFGSLYPIQAMPAVIISVISNFLAAMSVNIIVGKHLTRLKFILWAFLAALVAQPLLLFCTLAAGDTSINLLYNVLWSYGASVGAVMVFTPIVAILEGVFNIADDFRLDELTNLNQPLLKRLASEAPGTFNHSLVVGNLSEACANAIGENPHLARAAAYYHDIGKLKAPIYFSENQSTYNPHDELIPEVSVSMITSHTVFGEILAKQYRLPPEIVAVCKEHHGTAPVGYFYRKALNLTEEGELSVSNYTYSGPKPQSKVAAIVMIADTIEAAMRAYTPDTKEEFVDRINKLVDEKLTLGQFDECPITMKDLSTIKSTIIETLPRVQHGRVSYDKKKL